MVLYDVADTHGGTFGQISNFGGSGTTFYGYGIYYGSGHTATTITGCSQGISYGSGHTVTTITGCNRGLYYGSGHTVTTITGCSYGIYSGSGHTATTIMGCSYGIFVGSGHTATTITGCNNGIYYGSGHTATTITGCIYGINYGSGCTATTITGCNNGISCGSGCTVTTITGCGSGIGTGSHRLQNTTFSGNACDIRQAGPMIGYGCSLRSATQNSEYLLNRKDDVGQFFYDPVDGSDVLQKGRVIGWTSGGYISSEEASVPASPPIALDWCHKFTFESANFPVWVDVMAIRLKRGQSVSIPVYVKCTQTPSGMSEHPRVQLIDPNELWDSAGSKLDDEQITDTTDWQTVTVTYTADYDKEIWLRVRGTNATGTLYWWADPNVHPTPGGATSYLTLSKETGAAARGGSGTCAKLLPLNVNAYGYWSFFVPTDGTAFQLSFYYACTSGFNGDITVTIYDVDDTTKLLDAEDVGETADGTYYQYTATSVDPASAGLCRVQIHAMQGAHSAADVIFIDDVSMA